MLFLTRERLKQQLQQVGHLTDLYQSRDANFTERVIQWLAKVEENLQQLRNPLSSFIATERARILASLDGHRDPQLNDNKTSRSKASAATASLVLNQVVTRLLTVIQQIDDKFDAWREKMAQLLALASMKNPIPLPPTEPRQAWLQKVWRQMGQCEEAKGMYVYLNATMGPNDKWQLLDELIINMTVS